MTSTPPAMGAHLALSPAERAAVAAELAKLHARVANLATRLDRLHTALVAPEEETHGTQMAATPITRIPGPVTASGVRPWR